MTATVNEQGSNRGEPRSTWVTGSALVLMGLFFAIALLSPRFALGSNTLQRPIPLTIGLFTIAFCVYLLAVQQAVLVRNLSIAKIVGFAIAFRAITLFSTPILEIDVYRYIWDGNVAAAGINPYEFSPQQVQQAAEIADAPPNLIRLSALAASSPSLQKILDTVHFGNLPSPYPPVSQAVFATAAALTPDSTGIQTHLFVMRALIVVFDLATLWMVILILRELKRPPGWAIAYGWCPLVMKEFANSGHLDSITVFFTVAAIYALVRSKSRRAMVISAVLLAFATAGKFYPLVLLPVFVVGWLRLDQKKVETLWSQGMAVFAVYAATTAILLMPMFMDVSLPEKFVTGEKHTDGFHAFVRYWEMNDFLFMLVVENLKPMELSVASHPPWFVVVPDSVRVAIVDSGQSIGLPRTEVPFLLARLITVAIFGLIVLWASWKLWQQRSTDRFLKACFLSLAWLWFLAPTQNPWYWTWSLPLIPFVRGRSWLLVAGLAMMYYLRFWFDYHYANKPVFGTAYQGADFFDYVMTCVEFGPWMLICLGGGLLWNRVGKHHPTGESVAT